MVVAAANFRLPFPEGNLPTGEKKRENWPVSRASGNQLPEGKHGKKGPRMTLMSFPRRNRKRDNPVAVAGRGIWNQRRRQRHTSGDQHGKFSSCAISPDEVEKRSSASE
jgi:hypothetical protein